MDIHNNSYGIIMKEFILQCRAVSAYKQGGVVLGTHTCDISVLHVTYIGKHMSKPPRRPWEYHPKEITLEFRTIIWPWMDENDVPVVNDIKPLSYEINNGGVDVEIGFIVYSEGKTDRLWTRADLNYVHKIDKIDPLHEYRKFAEWLGSDTKLVDEYFGEKKGDIVEMDYHDFNPDDSDLPF